MSGSRDRALAAFQGLALGDALGMPTQSLSPQQIAQDHGRITGLVDAGPHQEIAAGLPAGTVTDDTEQAVLLARLLVEHDAHVPLTTYAEALMAWEERMRARGSLDLLGPSTKAALEQLAAGVPAEEAGRTGSTNGAAMRIAPVGIAVDAGDLAAFVDAVVEVSRGTHDTGLGLGAAAAVGAAVSAGVSGATRDEAVDTALAAGELAGRRGHWVAGGSIAGRLRWTLPHLRRLSPDERPAFVQGVIGTSVAAQESVVAALALAATADDPWDTLCLAASCGGDTDTIAAMAGAVLGATTGTAAWPADAVAQVAEVNGLDLAPLVDDLLALRTRGRRG